MIKRPSLSLLVLKVKSKVKIPPQKYYHFLGLKNLRFKRSSVNEIRLNKQTNIMLLYVQKISSMTFLKITKCNQCELQKIGKLYMIIINLITCYYAILVIIEGFSLQS